MLVHLHPRKGTKFFEYNADVAQLARAADL
jgi:hypothetical protein